jgi:uncharacterized membrane protein YdfJ with MMPL/SSD domain
MEQTNKYRWPIIISSIALLIIASLFAWQLFLPKKSPAELSNNQNTSDQTSEKQPDFKTADDLDGDGLSNTAEQEFGSNPNKADSDDDGLSDWKEKSLGTDPNKTDSDGDGIGDYDEYVNLGNPAGAGDLDSDGDGLSDKQELDLGSNPYSADTNQDGINDAEAQKQNISLIDNDLDKDGITNFEEEIRGTNPRQADSDGDGTDDYQQIFCHPRPNK